MWQAICGLVIGYGLGKVITTLIFVLKEEKKDGK